MKRAANEKEDRGNAAPGAELAVHPPLISHLAPGVTDRNVGNPELDKGVPSNLPCDREVLPRNQGTDIQGIAGSDAPNDAERIKQEHAATKAQAAIRGYLVIFSCCF